MSNKPFTPLLFLFCLLAVGGSPAYGQTVSETLRSLVENTDGAVVEGEDNWLFLKSELESYAKEKIAAAAEAGDDPLSVLQDFHQMLADEGVTLIVVPAPGKAAVFPDRVAEAELEGDALAGGAHAEFIANLKDAGVQVLDLAPIYREMREEGVESHLRQDSHWSPAGLERAAEEVAGILREQDWFAAAARGEGQTEEKSIQSLGDLVQLGNLEGYEPEEIVIQSVKPVEGSARDESSPVVLIGDSHSIVFSQPISGGISAENAGLADRLFALTGLRSDVVANQGSGVNVPRARLARRRGAQANLAGKKAVIWVFAARDLTEVERGWVKIPVIR